ncbi:hypothetical protein ISCGN_015691 [Ixodes scapularis]
MGAKVVPRRDAIAGCSHETSSAAEEAGNTKKLTVNEKRLRKGFYKDAVVTNAQAKQRVSFPLPPFGARDTNVRDKVAHCSFFFLRAHASCQPRGKKAKGPDTSTPESQTSRNARKEEGSRSFQLTKQPGRPGGSETPPRRPGFRQGRPSSLPTQKRPSGRAAVATKKKKKCPPTRKLSARGDDDDNFRYGLPSSTRESLEKYIRLSRGRTKRRCHASYLCVCSRRLHKGELVLVLVLRRVCGSRLLPSPPLLPPSLPPPLLLLSSSPPPPLRSIASVKCSLGDSIPSARPHSGSSPPHDPGDEDDGPKEAANPIGGMRGGGDARPAERDSGPRSPLGRPAARRETSLRSGRTSWEESDLLPLRPLTRPLVYVAQEMWSGRGADLESRDKKAPIETRARNLSVRQQSAKSS